MLENDFPRNPIRAPRGVEVGMMWVGNAHYRSRQETHSDCFIFCLVKPARCVTVQSDQRMAFKNGQTVVKRERMAAVSCASFESVAGGQRLIRTSSCTS